MSHHPYRHAEPIPPRYVYNGWVISLLAPYLTGMFLAYVLVFVGNLLGVIPMQTIYGMHRLVVWQMVASLFFGPVIHWSLQRVYPNQDKS